MRSVSTPQLFVRALDDPRALPFINPRVDVSAPDNFLDNCIGGSNLGIPTGAAQHLYTNLLPLALETGTDAFLLQDGECLLLENVSGAL